MLQEMDSESEMEPEPEQDMEAEQEIELEHQLGVERGMDMDWELEMSSEPQDNPGKDKGKQVVLNSSTPSPLPATREETPPVMKARYDDESALPATGVGVELGSDPDDSVSSPLSSLPSPLPPSIPTASASKAPMHPATSIAFSSHVSHPQTKFEKFGFARPDPYATLSPNHQASIKHWKDPNREKFNRWTGPRQYTSLTQNRVTAGCGLVLMSDCLRREHEAQDRLDIDQLEKAAQKKQQREQRLKGKRKVKQASPEL